MPSSPRPRIVFVAGPPPHEGLEVRAMATDPQAGRTLEDAVTAALALAA
jgi:hypothetical protein